jgi:class 3 adenylate cyclase/tetratricopeptide (TPR) repeat protein
MKCSKCQHENEVAAKFCEECAAPLGRTCAKCGRPLSPTAKFCPECAHPAALSPESLATTARLSSPESYTPKHLAEKILTSKAALEGERKQITVLFADLKGSMELLADRDPEDACKLLDAVVARMMQAVHHFEGTVSEVRGDGVMALFGAPLAHEDHALRACYAALRMQQAVKLYADEVRRSDGLLVQIRVGVNSGEVVVRSIGSDLRMDYSAVGRTTHMAARMEQLAAPGTIQLTAETLRLVEGFVQVSPLGPVPVKGLNKPIEVFELVGASAARTRFEAAARHGLTRFVGRSTELKQLRDALDQASLGRGQVVAVVGEPGVGKSRLFWEFTHSNRVPGWRIIQSTSVSYGKATTYLPVIALLRGYFELESRDDPRKIREKVTGKVLTLDPVLASAVPALLALLDVPVEEASWLALDPNQRRQQMLDAVKRLLLRESEVQPLVVIFEDLHWIDGETQALLDGLVDSLPAARLLLLVNYRPEYSHAWGSKTYYRQLRIDPLPPESSDELLAALLGNDAGLRPLKQLLIERTEGNPFFLEESVRALVESKALSGVHGAYRLVKAPQTLEIPATAQAILAARIDRLSPEDKRLLQAASVIGMDVPYLLLQSIVELPEEELRRGLAHLQVAEFLYEAQLFPSLAYIFKHALTHDVAYGGLVQEKRRALHANIVTAIETLYADRLADYVDKLAHHARRGETWEKAVTYLHQAGAKSASRSGYREAVAAFENALDALSHLPVSRERTEQAIDIHLDASGALLPKGALAESLNHADEARALAETLGDKRRLAWVLVPLSNRAWLSGDSHRALEVGERARAIAADLGDIVLQARVSWVLGLQRQTRGEYLQAVALLRWTLNAVESERDGEGFARSQFAVEWVRTRVVSVSARARLAWCLAELGDFTEAIACGNQAVRIAQEVDDTFSLVFAYRSLGSALLRRGDTAQSVSVLERSVELCRAARFKFPFDIAAGNLGYALALSGRLAEGVALMEEALADPAATGTSNHPLLMAYLGEAHLLAGRIDDAINVGRRALDLARRQQERGSEAWILRLLGEIAAHADALDLKRAREHYDEAIALAGELGMRPLVAHCHFGLGKLYRRIGNREQARERLTSAARMYRAMDMHFQFSEAEMHLLG